MSEIQLGTVESKFADIIWEHEPVHSREIVKLAGEKLNWKKSTTYTVLRRLCEKGIFKNDNSIVSAVMSRAEFYSMQSEMFVQETFDGSLPAFLAAFTARKGRLSPEEVKELRRMVAEYEEEV